MKIYLRARVVIIVINMGVIMIIGRRSIIGRAVGTPRRESRKTSNPQEYGIPKYQAISEWRGTNHEKLPFPFNQSHANQTLLIRYDSNQVDRFSRSALSKLNLLLHPKGQIPDKAIGRSKLAEGRLLVGNYEDLLTR